MWSVRRWSRLLFVFAAVLLLLLWTHCRGSTELELEQRQALGASESNPSPHADLTSDLDTSPPEPSAKRESIGGAPDAFTASGRYFRLVDSTARSPLPGGEGARGPVRRQAPEVRGDDLGFLMVPTRPDGQPVLWFLRAPGYAEVVVVDNSGGLSAASATGVALRACAALRVQLTEAEGQPIAGVHVQLTTELRATLGAPSDPEAFDLAYDGGRSGSRRHRSGLTGHSSSGETQWSARTAADGVCTWECLPPDVQLSALVVSDGHIVLRPKGISLRPGESHAVKWVLPAKTELTVIVVDQDGEPLSGYPLWIASATEGGFRCGGREQHLVFPKATRPFQESRTDEGGRAEFKHVPEGDWYVGPGAVRGADPREYDVLSVAPIGALVHLQAGPASNSVQLRADRGGFVAGVVVDNRGAPQPSVVIRLSALDVCGTSDVTTDNKGEFIVGPLRRVPHTLTAATASGITLSSMQVQPGDLAVLVEIPGACTLEVVLVDDQTGEPSPIESLAFFGEKTYFEHSEVGNRGIVRVQSIPSGSYTVIAKATSSKIAVLEEYHVRQELEATRATLVAHPAGTVSVTNNTGWLGTVQAFLGTHLVDTFGVPSGKTVNEQLPCGLIRLRMRSAGGSLDEKTVQLEPGETTPLAWP